MRGPAGIRCPPPDYSTGTGWWGQTGQTALGPITTGWKTDAKKGGDCGMGGCPKGYFVGSKIVALAG